MELKCLQDNRGKLLWNSGRRGGNLLEGNIYRQLDVMGIQISTRGKWWSLFQLVVNWFGVFKLKNFVCCFGMSLTGRLLSFVRFKLIVFPIYSGFMAI